MHATYGLDEGTGEILLEMDATDPTRVRSDAVVFEIIARAKPTDPVMARLTDATTGRTLTSLALDWRITISYDV